MESIITTLINIFNSTIDQIKKYGKSLILWTTILFFCIGMFIYFFNLNSILIDQFFKKPNEKEPVEIIEEQHNNEVIDRIQLNNEVYNLLYQFFYLNDEVINISIFEHHNGTTTLGKKSFLFITNTFELCKYNDAHFTNIQRLPISLFNIFNILYINNLNFDCSINELKNNDGKMYSIIKKITDAKHIYFYQINNEYNVGSVTIIVTTNNNFNYEIKDKLFQLANNLQILLT